MGERSVHQQHCNEVMSTYLSYSCLILVFSGNKSVKVAEKKFSMLLMYLSVVKMNHSGISSSSKDDEEAKVENGGSV